MKKTMSLMFCALFVGGCAARIENKGSEPVQEIPPASFVDKDENKLGEDSEQEKVVLEFLKENDCGEFDYTGKEHCFHPRGVWISEHYTIATEVDPHDYFVYWIYVYRNTYGHNFKKVQNMEKIMKVSIDGSVAGSVWDLLGSHGFVWEQDDNIRASEWEDE